MRCLNKDGFTPAVYAASAGVVMSWGSFFLGHYLSCTHCTFCWLLSNSKMFRYSHRASFRVHLGFVWMFSPNISKMSEQRFQYFQSMSQRIKAVPNAKRGLILVVAKCKDANIWISTDVEYYFSFLFFFFNVHSVSYVNVYLNYESTT